MIEERTIKSNVYRVLEMCSDCPFRDNGEAMDLRDGRVDDIKASLLESDHHSFNCHKTVYGLDSDMQSGQAQDEKMCAGAYAYLKSMDRPNMQMRLGQIYGIDHIDDDDKDRGKQDEQI